KESVIYFRDCKVYTYQNDHLKRNNYNYNNAKYMFLEAIHIVVPNIEHQVLAGGNGSEPIDHAGVGGADKVAGDNLRRGDVGDLLAQVGGQGDIAQGVVNLFHVHVLAQLQVQHSHGYIRGGNANRVAGELAFEFWQCIGDSLRSTGLGEHHVQPGSAATAITLMVVVNEVLVIGKRVRGFHVAVHYAVAVIDDLEHRGNTIGGTGCRRQ